MKDTRWYVLHAYSGYEKKVADSIIDQAKKLGIQEHIEDISVPTQNIVEVKRGVRVNTERKIFPGYILIKMNLNDDTWHIIKKPLSLGVFLIICQVSSFRFILINIYPGNIFLSELILTPLFTSTMF